MKAAKPLPPLNPLRLDVLALADRGEWLQGQAPVGSFARLADPGEPAPAADAALQWKARAERRPVRGGAPELWLHLQADVVVPRTCQRCLQPVDLPLALERDFLFAPTEEQAQAWDAERDEADVLVLSKSLNILELVEDELILELPLVPRHDACPQPLVATNCAPEGDEMSPKVKEGDNPFAVLAQLKRSQ